MNIQISELQPTEFKEVIDLLEACEQTHPNKVKRYIDSRSVESLRQIQCRNLCLCLVAKEHGRIIGVILCDQDGLNGHTHEMAISLAYHNQGIEVQLINRALQKMSHHGIHKTRIRLGHGSYRREAFWHQALWKPMAS